MVPAAARMPPENQPELLRAAIFHTPRNPFTDDRALVSFADGGLLIQGGRIAGCGDYSELRARHPGVPVRDLRGGYLLPGFIDAHLHFPQIRVLGGLGLQLLDWLEQIALPEEARMADIATACDVARRFVRALAAHGTTTALVFGSHFKPATEALFRAAEKLGLRIVSGLVMSDRKLRPDLHRSPADAYRESLQLIREYHGRGRLLYAVTPRFALSASEEMLEVCQTLVRENPGVLFQTHINENLEEVEQVAAAFPWAKDYLAVYEKFNLAGPLSVMAHNVHATDSELERIAAAGASVAHCPSSNAMLGSGLFPLRRHLRAGVRVALGTDVGAGTGFGVPKEALAAYALQRLAPDGMLLSPAHLLYLATRAGAEALHLEHETGDFATGKSADFVYFRAPEGSLLEGALEHSKNARADSLDRALAALFTLAGAECVAEVSIAGAALPRDLSNSC
jgi:guanine deaminase